MHDIGKVAVPQHILSKPTSLDEEEFEIVNRVSKEGFKEVSQVATKEDIDSLKSEAKRVFVDDEVQKYMLKIIFATRYPNEYGLEEWSEYIEFGASPRASIDLYNASCAVALIRGKDYVTPLDIAEVVTNVLQHRIVLSYKAEAKGISAKDVVKKILQCIKAP